MNRSPARVDGGAAQDLVGGKPQDSLRRGITKCDHPLCIVKDDAFRQGRNDRGIPFFTFSKGLFRRLSVARYPAR